jgi:hypothetical protein
LKTGLILSTYRPRGRKFEACREIATAVIVMLLSPASVVFVLAIGISPEAWRMICLRYVAFIHHPAILVALAGFDVVASYWLRAERAKTQKLKDKP